MIHDCLFTVITINIFHTLMGTVSSLILALMIALKLPGYGVACEDLVCSVNPCQNGGRCIAEVVNRTEVQNCLCSLPYSGEFCTEGIPIY